MGKSPLQSFTYGQINSIIQATATLRVSSSINWELSRRFSRAVGEAFQAKFEKLSEEAKSLLERKEEKLRTYRKEFAKIVGEEADKKDARKALNTDLNEFVELHELDSKKFHEEKHEIEFKAFSESEFKDVNLDGNREIPQQDGGLLKLSYREAYYELERLGIIK